jgi:hypothetical protein
MRWVVSTPPSNTSDNFTTIHALVPDTNEYKSVQIVSVAGTFTNLAVKSLGTLSGADTYTVTLRVNGVDSALALTVGAAGTSGSVTGSVAVVAGDKVTMKFVQSGTGTAAGWLLAITAW